MKLRIPHSELTKRRFRRVEEGGPVQGLIQHPPTRSGKERIQIPAQIEDGRPGRNIRKTKRIGRN
ncbi:MAG: hypothetical protein DRH56_10425 [Deltaproteobacteria bacterium]|nr:MAG: hypothetical protein DRH56_10425 [Deltaproteobacteria bacterium]